MKYQRRLRLRFPLEALGTMGVMVFVASLMLLVFCYLLCLIAALFTFGVWPYHFVCGAVFLLVFSYLLFGIALYVLRVLRIGWEKRKFSGARGKLNEIQQEM